MAMMSQSAPLTILGCPVGECQGQSRARTQTSWRALAASFAAGGVAVSALIALAGSASAPAAVRVPTAREAAASERAATVRAQLPSELPREWRHEIRGVDLRGMYRKQR